MLAPETRQAFRGLPVCEFPELLGVRFITLDSAPLRLGSFKVQTPKAEVRVKSRRLPVGSAVWPGGAGGLRYKERRIAGTDGDT